MEGRSLVAGTYTFTADFLERVLAPFGARFRLEAPFRPTVIRSVVADGDTVVIVRDGHGVAYDDSYAWIMRLAAGKVVEGGVFFDAKAFDELWTRVEGGVR